MHSTQDIIRFWRKVVVSEDVDLSAYDLLLNVQTRDSLLRWMFLSLLAGAEVALKEFGYEQPKVESPDLPLFLTEGLIQLKRKCPNSTSRIFHSWPALIRRSREFNCVGGVLLLLQAFQRSGLKSYIGVLPFHLVNFVLEVNNEIEGFYLDPTNAIKEPIRLVEIGEVEGMPLALLDRRIDFFKQALLAPPESIVLFVLENVALVPRLATDTNFSIKRHPTEKDEAREVYNEHQDLFERLSLDKLAQDLFPWRRGIQEHPLIKSDMSVVDALMQAKGVAMVGAMETA